MFNEPSKIRTQTQKAPNTLSGTGKSRTASIPLSLTCIPLLVNKNHNYCTLACRNSHLSILNSSLFLANRSKTSLRTSKCSCISLLAIVHVYNYLTIPYHVCKNLIDKALKHRWCILQPHCHPHKLKLS